jgi:radical SAM superfamily enzyme YgiQ (UPF0313 family)
MRTALIEASRPNSVFAKYKSQFILPNILLDIAGVLDGEVKLYNALKDRSFILPEADRYIVNISECVEKTREDVYVVDLLKQLRAAQNNLMSNSQVYLVGWYAWLNREHLEKDFKVLHPLLYEMEFTDKSPDEIIPRWDLINMSEAPEISGKRRATLRTTRGCPNKCEMCPVNLVYNQQTYKFSLIWIKRQVQTLYNMGFREINFIDDNFLFDKARSKELLKYLISEKKTSLKGMRYLFHEGMEVNQAQDEELIKMLKEAGFHDIKLGVESLNPKTLEYINKPYKDPKLAIKAIENFNKYGIKPNLLIIFGLPTDTEEDYTKMIDILSKLKVKIRAQKLYGYQGKQYTSPVSKERLSELMNELLEKTGSAIW